MAKRFALCSICFEVISNSDCAELQTRSSTENRFMQKPNHVGLATCCSSLKSGISVIVTGIFILGWMLTCTLLQGLQTFMSIKEDFPWPGENTQFFLLLSLLGKQDKCVFSLPLSPKSSSRESAQDAVAGSVCVWGLSVKILFYMEITLFTTVCFK